MLIRLYQYLSAEHSLVSPKVKKLKMKVLLVNLVVLAGIAAVISQKEGSAFTQDALREIQQRQLIPPNARIQRVSIGIIKVSFMLMRFLPGKNL